MGLLAQTRQLLLFTLWADRVMLDAARGVSPEHLVRDAGVSFGSMLGTLSHILGSQRRWMARFMGQEAILGDPPVSDLETLAANWSETASELEFLLASLTEEQLAADIIWTNQGRDHHPASLAAGVPHGEPLDVPPGAGGVADAPARVSAAEDGPDPLLSEIGRSVSPGSASATIPRHE